MVNFSSIRSLAELRQMQTNELAELKRLVSEREYLERKMKLNAECIKFMEFSLHRRQREIMENSHKVGPWSVGFYSHDAD